ncbi:hypothetical protein BP5796_02314 [Coleophoma crateriformis]|uniref:Uncharacterized protein n=1 Tax=Coleophoma crateriformis TaxID=565419 RepID=A0A3D8SY12_9HELO|nr:hypothetical protein BP5796_02314 [Coleophoma crateriformis]
MADTENFEEDLFADLYTDEDNAAKPSASAAPEVKLEPAAPVTKNEEPTEQAAHNGDGDQQMYGGEQDVDDEVDFTLGNANGYDGPKDEYKSEEHGPDVWRVQGLVAGRRNMDMSNGMMDRQRLQLQPKLAPNKEKRGGQGKTAVKGFYDKWISHSEARAWE